MVLLQSADFSRFFDFSTPLTSGETTMKRILVAVVLALSVVSVVGCGSGSATKTSSETKKS